MKYLVAVATCHRFRPRVDVLRRTWVPEFGNRNTDVCFFFGGGEPQSEDEVCLDCPDDYEHLRQKVQLLFRWAVELDYDFILKCDDDVYLIPGNLFKNHKQCAYEGRLRAPSRERGAPEIYGPREFPFCSGFVYWISKLAATVIAVAPDNGDWAEDRFVGNALAKAGIQARHDPTFTLWPPLQGHVCRAPHGSCLKCLAQYNGASAVCPYARPDVIERLHAMYKASGAIPAWLP